MYFNFSSPIVLLSVVLIIGSVKLKPEHSLMAYGQVQVCLMFISGNIVSTCQSLYESKMYADSVL